MDCGNPRYYAEKAESQVGLLFGHKSRSNGFVSVPSELPSELEKNEDEASPLPEENISEISFPDELASQGEEQVQDEKSNYGGAMLNTWGSGFQKGMKLGPESPRWNKNDDKLTVASSAVEYQASIVSNASTAFYSRECKKLESDVKEQRNARQKLMAELEQYKAITNHNQ
jgi:hypothetical protein